MRVFYRGQRDQVIRAIQNSPLAGHCTISRQDAGLHFLLRLDTKREDGDLSALAEAQNLRLSFLSDYQQQPGAAEPHTLVVNYPGVEMEHLGRALEILARLR
jgi:GntR family transcriptional regulator/MocR family aminotransferase